MVERVRPKRKQRPWVYKSRVEQQRQKNIARMRPLDLKRYADKPLVLERLHTFRDGKGVVIGFTTNRGTISITLPVAENGVVVCRKMLKVVEGFAEEASVELE